MVVLVRSWLWGSESRSIGGGEAGQPGGRGRGRKECFVVGGGLAGEGESD